LHLNIKKFIKLHYMQTLWIDICFCKVSITRLKSKNMLTQKVHVYVLFTFLSSPCVLYCLHFSQVHVYYRIVYIFRKSICTVLFTFLSSPCVLYCLHFSQAHVHAQLRALARNSVIIAFVFSLFLFNIWNALNAINYCTIPFSNEIIQFKLW